MRVETKIKAFFLLAVLLFSFFALGYTIRSAKTLSEEKTTAPAEVSNWTFMVYLDSDNNLETFGIKDFLEMASVGSTPNVNIVVQMDRIPKYNASYGDWTDCRRFFITQGQTPMPENAVEDLGEVDMGDPNTLVNFTVWGIQNHPAYHYVLVLWDHGSGWKSASTANVESTFSTDEVKGVCFDSTSNTSISTIELGQALATAESITGVKLDIVGFDACLMAMIEIAYQIKDYADIIAASEEVEPADGWPYDNVLFNLTSNPTMTSSELATVIVTDYVASYTSFVTFSAANLQLVTHALIDDLVMATSNFAQTLKNVLSTYHNEIVQARQQTEEYFYPTYIDLYHFAQLIRMLISDQEVQIAADEVMTTLTTNVIAEGHKSDHPDSHGLSIYFPQFAEDYESSYENLTFAAETMWDEFVKAFLGILSHNVAVISITSKTIVGQGYFTFVNVTVANQGDYAETFNVTLYANTAVLASQNATLTVGNSTTIRLMWNTTGFLKGNYTLWAYAWPVLGETETENNKLTYGTVLVGVPCDITGPTPNVPDGTCDMRDIGYICNKFGTTPSSPDWDSNCDVTGFTPRLPDDTVDMRDIGEACNNFMKT